MELTRFTDYSLRTLIFVALKNGELVSIREIAAAYAVSENHLTKVVHGLAKLDYLKTFQGRGGGISLGKAPSEINVGQIVREMEGIAVVECLREDGSGTCCIAGVCKLQNALRRATDAFLNELDKLTLADLVQNESDLNERLGIEQG